MNVKRTGPASYRGTHHPRTEEKPMPKSRARKSKKRPQRFEPRDPVLGEVLVGRGWRYLGASEVADCWDFPAFNAVDAHALITCQPDGYSADLGTEGINLLSKIHASRHALIQELDLIESWGEQIRDAQEATARDRAVGTGLPHT
jgi:hypothetical protein